MKKTLIIIYVFTAILFGTNTIAQHQEISEKPTVWKEKSNEKIDSTSILNAFKNGHFSGYFRYFFMSTNNESGLSDYYANALGGGIKFETANFHNFQFGISGYYIFNIDSSNFTEKDATTNGSNRYEVSLFDIQNPTNKEDLSRLEELYINYNYKNSNIILGKQLLNTSFINLQDGRMRPTEVNGIWVDFSELKKTKINFGYLYEISPRSTLNYFDVGHSIGIYPTGVNPDGTKSDYAGNLDSNGIYIFGVQNELIKNLKTLLWNQYAENILAPYKFGVIF